MPRPFHAQTKLAADPDRFTDAQAAATASAVTGFRAVASEALLDEDSIKRFRSRYRERFGANATSNLNSTSD